MHPARNQKELHKSSVLLLRVKLQGVAKEKKKKRKAACKAKSQCNTGGIICKDPEPALSGYTRMSTRKQRVTAH